MMAVEPLGWLTGGLIALDWPTIEPPVLLPVGLLIVPGVIAALDRRVPIGFVGPIRLVRRS
jgi:hypothetical protein